MNKHLLSKTLFLMSFAILSGSKVIAGDIEISGLIDVGFTHSFNDPNRAQNNTNISPDGTGGIDRRSFNDQDDTFQITLAQLKVSKETDPVGFEIKLDFFKVAGGIDGNGANGNDDIAIHTANISYSPPIDQNLTITVGKMDTLLGRDLFESNGNWFQSFGFLFEFTPSTHTGVRMTLDVLEHFSLIVGFNNGSGKDIDDNHGKSVEAGIYYNPTETLELSAAFNYGSENAGDESNKNLSINLIASWQTTETLDTYLEFLYVNTENEFGNEDGQILGFGIGRQYRITDKYGVSSRFEYVDEKTGISSDNQLWQITLTANIWLSEDLECRIEYRHDESDNKDFDKEGNVSDRQNTLGIQVLYSF